MKENTHKSTPERVIAFSDGVFAIIITIMILELKRPAAPTFAALFAEWPHMGKLHCQLYIYSNCMAAASFSAALCGGGYNSVNVDQFCSLVCSLAGAFSDRLDGRYTHGSCTGGLLCLCVFDGEYYLPFADLAND